MKKIFILCTALLLCAVVQVIAQKSSLKILYVGGSPDLDTFVSRVDSLVLQQSIKERTASFEGMLKAYFETVKVVDAKDYEPEMSDRYDVTIFDGKLRERAPEKIEKDASGRIVSKIAASYLPENFNRPAVMLAEMGETLGRRLGLKNDWYCLCLDADAHSFRAEHPIFHEPFPVKMTLRTEPTPENAFHYAYFSDGPIPDSILMWKVQTKGYKTEEGFRIGMVSRPWGFEDFPDAEYISSGVCAKTLDAVAIGRHGNFLHWGFAASPKYMTEEAKAVFANAVVYISKFAGQTPIARKYNGWISTRDYIKELRYLSTRKAWEESLKSAPLRTYEQYLLHYQGDLFEKFGTDEQAYQRYYDENRDYFYGGEGIYTLTVDEDVKSLGIPVREQCLLDKVIGMWEKGQDVEKARRILNRYTLCRYNTAREWRDWYETNKGRMFFTESGGWLFMLNTRDKSVPGNDYHVRDVKLATLPQIEATDFQNPVQVAVGMNKTGKGKQEVVVRVKIHAGYHIYAHVADRDPFIPTTIEINLPEGYQLVGDLKCPSFNALGKSGTTIYENEAVFRQEITGSGEGEITCVIGYQCCDSHVCMTPVKKEYVVKIQ